MTFKIDFPIVDPHVHYWDPYNTPHEAALLVKMLGRHPRLMQKLVRLIKPKSMIDTFGLLDYSLNAFLPKDYLADCKEIDVESIVHVEADWYERKGLGPANETKWLEQLPFKQTGIKLGAIVGGADPRASNIDELLEAHQLNSPVFRGLRKMAAYHEDPGVMNWCDQPGLYMSKDFLCGFDQLSKRGLSFDAWCYSEQLSDIEVLAKRFPNTKIVIDHLATPAGVFSPVGRFTGRTKKDRDDIFLQWKDSIARFADHPNVFAKISGLMMPVLGHRFHHQNRLASIDEIVQLLSPLIEHAINVFGHKRLMFASNFPMDKVSTSLTNLLKAYQQMIVPYGENALMGIFRDNAKRFYQC